jgi:peptidoglycan/LPS O-acetylase OafA/YrhL
MQNFSRKDLEFFPVSWSLSIEEWFYLLIPLALLLAARLGGRRQRAAFFGACLGVIALSLLLRIVYVAGWDPTWDFGLRKKPPLRMDSLMVGVALAGISVHLPKAWARLASRKRILFPLAGAGLLYTGGYLWTQFHEHAIDSSNYARTTLFLVVSLLAAVILAGLETSESVNVTAARWGWTRVFRFLSVTSYAAYLLHTEIFDAFRPLAAKSGSAPATLLIATTALALTLLLSTVMYRRFEKPILRWRDRRTRGAA